MTGKKLCGRDARLPEGKNNARTRTAAPREATPQEATV